MSRPVLIDLFCGAGGAAAGYHAAGWDVVGIDSRPQPHYPFRFIMGDALRPPLDLRSVAAIHASPPCQAFTKASFTTANRARHPDLIARTRSLLIASDRPYVIENVPRSPLYQPIILCGLMFGLKVLRHRWFECSHVVMTPDHPSHRGVLIGRDGYCCVVGHGGGATRRIRDQVLRNRHGSGGQQSKAEWSAAMGINWMTNRELAQAIPPAYTQWIGKQLLRVV